MRELFESLVEEGEITVSSWDRYGEPEPDVSHKAIRLLANACASNSPTSFDCALSSASDEILTNFIMTNEAPNAMNHANLGARVMYFVNGLLWTEGVFDKFTKNDLCALLKDKFSIERETYLNSLDLNEDPWDVEVQGGTH